MTTNPYAAPVDAGDPINRAEYEIRGVIRTFRILAIFSIATALFVCMTILQSLVSSGIDLITNVVFATVHIAMIAFSVFYLRVAAGMARREVDVAVRARWLCLLMILGFPLFPIGLVCVPLFSIAGLLCYRKVKRYYPDYCEVAQP